jgi:hypothetical protein
MGVTTTATTCNNPNGNAMVNVTGSSGPYTYLWSNGATYYYAGGSNYSGNLVGGNYTVTITDANGCTQTTVANVPSSTSTVSATFTSSPACVNTLMNFTNTGTPPGTGITYNWLISPITPTNASGQTTDFSYTFLTTGTYSIQHSVGDGTCTNTVTQTITVVNCSTAPTVTATSNSVCPGLCATVTSSPIGGTSPYTYSWSTGETTQNINPCPATTTTYTLKVTDTGGATTTTTVTATVNPAINISATAILNCGTNNGSVTATVTGGSSSFTYSWSNGVTTTTNSLTSQISNLASNTYSVTVTDAKGCSTSSSAIIDPPFGAQYIKGSANCAGCGCKEWIMVNPSNGRAPYTYTWPGGYDKGYLNKLCPGTYNINITDKNGCSINMTVNAP